VTIDLTLWSPSAPVSVDWDRNAYCGMLGTLKNRSITEMTLPTRNSAGFVGRTVLMSGQSCNKGDLEGPFRNMTLTPQYSGLGGTTDSTLRGAARTGSGRSSNILVGDAEAPTKRRAMETKTLYCIVAVRWSLLGSVASCPYCGGRATLYTFDST
jgi:hypothetical protein